jgi:putative MATE family efflux protein
MESITSNNDLKVKVDNRQILSIALPITLAILIPQLNMLVNSIFIGHLSQEALGNAGITGVFYLIFAVAGHGLNSSMQSVFSGYAGSGKPEAFKTVLSQGIRISLQLAFVFILFTWFLAPIILKNVSNPSDFPMEMSFLKIRIFGLPFLFLFQMGNAFLIASLNSRYLMIGFICEALFNILFDYVLIFGKFGFPEMGFNGAAVASVIAECIGMVVVFLVIISTGLKKKFNLLSSFAHEPIISKQIIKVAFPLVLQFILSLATWLVFFLLIESHGPMAKAISNTMRNVFGLAGIFIWAFAGTSNTMVSNLIGQKRQDMVLPVVNKIARWSFGLCCIIILLLNIFPGTFFSLFGQSNAFLTQGIPVIRIVSCGMLFMSVANIWLNALTGTGKTKINLAIELFAISMYLIYTWYFMKVNYISLAMAWSNEFVYWFIILMMSYLYLKSGWWQKKEITWRVRKRYIKNKLKSSHKPQKHH